MSILSNVDGFSLSEKLHSVALVRHLLQIQDNGDVAVDRALRCDQRTLKLHRSKKYSQAARVTQFFN